MSVPLPPHHAKRSFKAREIFLDSDERWEVYQLKAMERPHLISLSGNRDNIRDGEEEECCCKEDSGHLSNEEIPTPSVVDGCDIIGWRHEHIMDVNQDIQGVLNLGASSFYFRKQSQWPVLKSSSCCWDQLHSKLRTKPPNSPPSVNCREASVSVDMEGGLQATVFAWEWERRNRPVVLTSCTIDWKAMPSFSDSTSGWTFDNLLRRFGDIAWRFSDSHGRMLTLSTYHKYISGIEGMTDDSPLAIYDAEFGDDELTKILLEEYTVPQCFSPDLFAFADKTNFTADERPPYRWILIGPARSGTGLHIDPLWTNAWVTVLQGCKRWMLFPKETPADAIGMQNPQIPSVIWFRDYYDKVTSPKWPTEWKPVEVLQYPGETVFVPNGWPHLVLNLELTVAVTHNYASEFGPFLRMWKEIVVEEPAFARVWYTGLQQQRPDLAKQIQQFHSAEATKKEKWAMEFSLIVP